MLWTFGDASIIYVEVECGFRNEQQFYLNYVYNYNYNNLLFHLNLQMGQVERKRVLCHIRTTNAQISLHIRAVWSAPAFVVRSLDSIISLVSRSEISRF